MFSVSVWSVLAVACVFVLLLVIWSRNSGKNKLPRPVYQKKMSLFNADDQRFYRTLLEAVGDDYIVFSKIRISDIIIPQKGSHGQAIDSGYAQVANLCFDFVLLEPQNFGIACLVLAQEKLDFAKQENLQAICDAVALPLACFSLKKSHSAGEVRDNLLQLLQDNPLTFTESYGRKEPRISSFEDIKL